MAVLCGTVSLEPSPVTVSVLFRGETPDWEKEALAASLSRSNLAFFLLLRSAPHMLSLFGLVSPDWGIDVFDSEIRCRSSGRVLVLLG